MLNDKKNSFFFLLFQVLTNQERGKKKKINVSQTVQKVVYQNNTQKKNPTMHFFTKISEQMSTHMFIQVTLY